MNCRRVLVRGSRRLSVPPEGSVCATKLHRAKIDGPAVAGPSFFAIFGQRQPQAACIPGGFSVCNEVAPSENRRSRGSRAVVFRDKVASLTTS